MFDLLKTNDIDSVENRDLGLIDWLAPMSGWFLKNYFRASVRGLERIPRGPGLYVANHSMPMLSLDSFILFIEAYKHCGVDSIPYGLAHDVPIRAPIVNQLLTSFGAVRACHENAHKVFESGRKALVYPGGDVDSCRPFKHRNKIVFGGRTGYIKLALTENVPIIPAVTAGAHSANIVITDNRRLAKKLRLDKIFRTEVWPIMLAFPTGIVPGPFPFYIPYPSKIIQEVLEPVYFERTGLEAAKNEEYVRQCADFVETAMQEALTRLAKERSRKKRR